MTIDGGVATIIVGALTILTMLFLAGVGGIMSLIFRILDTLHKQRENVTALRAELNARVSALESQILRTNVTGIDRAVQSWEEANPVPQDILDRMRADPTLDSFTAEEIEHSIQEWDHEIDLLIEKLRGGVDVRAKLGTARYIVATLNGIKARRDTQDYHRRIKSEQENVRGPSLFDFLKEMWG